MVFSKNDTYNRKCVMKSIKTNPNSAKVPDIGKNCKQIALHIIDNTSCLDYIFLEKKET